MGTSSVILGNSRRMLMIEYLQKSDGRAELRDMVEYIAENEGNTDRKHRKSVYVSLVQTHIPKLEREGVITFKHGVITLVKVPDDVTVYMETVKKNDISWSSFYIGLSLMFFITALYLNNLHLALASLVYAGVGVIHHRKMKRI
ncbi:MULTISPECIES: hypothetical protein [Thermococcus]|uniref:DUF7344 domain-containing protein n=1 Tax=Thermococcus nautili TaxID=195522 RepID=W8P2S4_9EURY|nr:MULTISPECIES: hypothetical protein [Thermococcus]AHL23106.1 hypothetical protein BD01_1498 [Thermococcus nautili]NJE49398.1 hypothetical protein [Thermococcus sp. 9N3]CAI1492431.1 conserved protein of unknown function [Thermococcus nautili]